MIWLQGWSFPAHLWSAEGLHLDNNLQHRFEDFSRSRSVAELREVALAALFAEKGPARVLGWSLGAMVALELARDYPERVRALYLVGATGSFVAPPASDLGWPEHTLEDMMLRLEEDRDATLRWFYRQIFTSDERRAGHLRTLLEHAAGAEQSPMALRAGLDYLRTYALDPHRITRPVYLLHGERDTICPLGAAERLVLGLPGAALTVVEGAGHAPFISNRPRFIEWLNDSIARS
jgi:pimeloyl-[acyl-carrier protein] methyl ester esterase